MPWRDHIWRSAGGLLVMAVAELSGAAQHAYVTTEHLNTVAVIDTEIDAMVDQIPLSVGWSDIAVSPDGTRAYVVDTDSDQLTVLAVPALDVVERIPLGRAPGRLEVSADGRYAYVIGLPTIRIDFETGMVTPLVNVFAPRDLAISPDGSEVYFASVAGVEILDADTMDVVTVASAYATSGVALSPDGRRAYFSGNTAGTAEARLLVLDTATRAIVLNVQVSANPYVSPRNVALTPDGARLILSGSYGDALFIVDAATGQIRQRMDGARGLGRVVASPTKNEVYVGGLPADAVSAVDAANGRLTLTVPGGIDPTGIATSPDGNFLYVAATNAVRVFATSDGRLVGELPGGRDPTAIKARRDGRVVYVANQASGSVGVIDTTQRRLTRSIETGGNPLGLVLSPDESRLYVSSFATSNTSGGMVFVIDTVTNTVRKVIEVTGLAGGIAITPDGRRVLVSHALTHRMSVIDAEADRLLHTVEVGFDPKGIAITGDGRVGLIGIEIPGTLRFFDPHNLDPAKPAITGEVALNPGHHQEPCAIALSAEGTHAFVADRALGYVYRVDVAARAVEASTSVTLVYSADACGIALTPDDRRVYVANNSNDVVTVLDGNDLTLLYHIPVLPRPYDIAISCPGGCPTALPTHTRTATPTPTPSPLPSATATPYPCIGDCDSDGVITISEIVNGVGIALERRALRECGSFDAIVDGRVTVPELIGAINAALRGCQGGIAR